MNEPKIEIDYSKPATWSVSSPTAFIVSGTWRCTPQLRWKQEPAQTIYELQPPPKLQQLWVELETGKQDWRDVPIEI